VLCQRFRDRCAVHPASTWVTPVETLGNESLTEVTIDLEIFGVSWQIVPDGMSKFLGVPDDAGRARATAAMLNMTKLDLAALKTAYSGTL
jgi:hypothetical protein